MNSGAQCEMAKCSFEAHAEIDVKVFITVHIIYLLYIARLRLSAS